MCTLRSIENAVGSSIFTRGCSRIQGGKSIINVCTTDTQLYCSVDEESNAAEESLDMNRMRYSPQTSHGPLWLRRLSCKMDHIEAPKKINGARKEVTAGRRIEKG